MAQVALDENVLDFIALGGVWLDEIRNEDGESVVDVPGGSVTFATLGARLFAASQPGSVGMLMRAGHDFPPDVVEIFRSWGIALQVLHEHVPSARGIVQLQTVDGPRAYERLTEPLDVTLGHLATSHVGQARALHFFDTPLGLTEQLNEIDGATPPAQKAGAVPLRPLTVWEPQVRTCTPDQLDEHVQAAARVDVFSPNHGELAKLLGDTQGGEFQPSKVEAQARLFLRMRGVGPNSDGCIVARAGSHGCAVVQDGMNATWLPAYHDGDSARVVNTTGAGNAFLGGFSIGYLRTRNFVQAAAYGNVAASFAVEQIGLPQLSTVSGQELWNVDNVKRRLTSYMARLDGSFLPSLHSRDEFVRP